MRMATPKKSNRNNNILFAGGQESSVGASEAHRNAEALSASNDNISAPLSRGPQLHQGHEVSGSNNGSAILLGGGSQRL